MSSRGSRIMLWTAPAAADRILTILENHRPRDHTLAPLLHHLGDHLGIIFDTSGLQGPAEWSMVDQFFGGSKKRWKIFHASLRNEPQARGGGAV